ncbi:hypothetical protein [Saliphagus sp. LR7]|uniref:hypothetical protein n=1 Tax=Saliphagus sp. LR7 TaxID=2282654 RepID=UPI000DF73CEF|nr:hypothetical protein [Saliphagus sp. LR7]
MSWSDRNESDDESDGETESALDDEFDEWVREGGEPGPRGQTGSNADHVSRGQEPRQRGVADDPLAMTQCPRCDSRRFVSKKLVYEEFHYSEGGDLERHQNRVRAEFEYTCIGCDKRFHELPKGARSYYSEVAVLKQDLRKAIRVQVRTWAGSVCEFVRRPFRD